MFCCFEKRFERKKKITNILEQSGNMLLIQKCLKYLVCFLFSIHACMGKSLDDSKHMAVLLLL